MNPFIDWQSGRCLLKGIHKNELNPQGDPKAFDNLALFKSILLGHRHSLSEPALEEALRVRLDFMLFTGFEIEDDTPDKTTVCRFRNTIIHKGLHERLFREINRQLEKHGIKVKEAEGALLDTTIVISAARPKKTVEPDHTTFCKVRDKDPIQNFR